MVDTTDNSMHTEIERIISELNSAYFSKFLSVIENALCCIIDENQTFDNHVEASRDCLVEFFNKYYSDNIL